MQLKTISVNKNIINGVGDTYKVAIIKIGSI